MARIVIYGVNLLETATVTVSGEVAGKPKERLFDREIGLFYQDTSNTGDRVIKANQGGGGTQAIDGLYVGPGHNLSGSTVYLESSPDDAVWTPRGNLAVPSSAAFRIKVAPGGGVPWTTQYTRVRIASAPAPPSIGEALISLSWTAPYHVSEPGSQGLEPNIRVHRSTSGKAWAAQRGEPAWRAEYLIRDLSLTDRSGLEQVYRDLDGGAKPFAIEDADAVLRWARLLNALRFPAVPRYNFDIRLDLQEEF